MHDPLRRIPRRALLRLSAATALTAAACGSKSDGAKQTAQTATGGTPVASAGHGLLLPRDQRLLLRDMGNGKEFVLKRATADAFYTYPRWSPDGRRIAYALDVQYTGVPSQNWGSDLAMIPADGSTEHIVLRRPNSGFKFEGLAWVADGSALIAGVLDTTIKDGRFVGQTLRIERIDAATGDRRPLIENGSMPTAAPDGSRIAFVTYATADDSGGLWTAKPDGSDRRLILPLGGQIAALAQPRFSPDSRSIAFSATTVVTGWDTGDGEPAARGRAGNARAAALHGLPQDIWQVDADGGQPQRLTNFQEDEPSVAWAPDGKQLAIVATGGLYQMPLPPGEPRKIGLGGTLVQIDWR